MKDFKKWHYATISKKVIEALNKNHFEAFYVDNKEEARKKVLSLIEKGASIGLGGSITLMEMGIIDDLRSGDYVLYDRYDPNLTPAELVEVFRKSMLADYFLTGTNAITLDGKLVNIDGRGNRVAAMIYGPKKVIVVAGANKIVKNVDEALSRIGMVAAPRNAERLDRNTPCRELGYCIDCNSKDRMCSFTTIIGKQELTPNRITVILVGEDLGF